MTSGEACHLLDLPFYSRRNQSIGSEGYGKEWVLFERILGHVDYVCLHDDDTGIAIR